MSYELIHAAIEGNLEEVERLIGAGAELDFKDECGQTALIWAAACGQTATCNLLLERGANVNLQSDRGLTALTASATYGRTETCELLLSFSADVNLKNKDGLTALMSAAQNGQKEICKLLISKGAKIDEKDFNDYWSCIVRHIAIKLFKIGATIFGVVCVAGVVALIISPASIVAVGALGASLLASLGTSAASLVGVSVASKAIAITAGSAISAAVVGTGCFGLYKGLQAFVTMGLKFNVEKNVIGAATAADTTVGAGAGASAAVLSAA